MALKYLLMTRLMQMNSFNGFCYCQKFSSKSNSPLNRGYLRTFSMNSLLCRELIWVMADHKPEAFSNEMEAIFSCSCLATRGEDQKRGCAHSYLCYGVSRKV